MSNAIAFESWAPPGGRWSPWVKPVLFAHMDPAVSLDDALPLELPAAPWAPAVDEAFALVLDLPGDQGVLAGLAVAALGYQPVPLYNACPSAGQELALAGEDARAAAPDGRGDHSADGGVGTSPFPALVPTSVDVAPIIKSLRRGAAQLRHTFLPNDAPPAFLLDSRRRGHSSAAPAGSFDNRTVSFPTDFPSGNFLLSRGIGRVLLVQPALGLPQEDLAHTLLRWRDGGLEVLAVGVDGASVAQQCGIPRPRWYRSAFLRLLAGFGLRRNILGGFGGVVGEGAGG